jgi:hypothetical protein
MHCLIEAAEGRGPMMFARVGMSRAINHGKPVAARVKRTKAYRIVS